MSELYPFQKKAVRKVNHFKGRALLGDEMGLGKTHEALGWLKQHPKIRPVVVVCPANAKWVWESIASIHFGMRGRVLEGVIPSEIRLTKMNPVLIINYEILPYWLVYLQDISPRVVVIDEPHYIKNSRAKRTKAVRTLCEDVPYILSTGGTPLLNRPSELWQILNLIRPDEFPSKFLYVWRYCKPVKLPWGWSYKGADNLSELHRKLNTLLMIRQLKKDVMSELPDKTRQIVPLEIDDDNEYAEAENNFIRWLTKKSPAKAQRAQKAEKLTQMGYLKRLAAQLKMKPVLEWVDSFLEESDGKLVLFCTHRSIVKTLHEKYKGTSVVLDGSVNSTNRKLAVRSFQDNKRIRVFIGNIKAAGAVITLTAASTLAFVEMDWVPGNHLQAEDRIHRIGQENAAMIYYLVAKGTIEEMLCQILQEKQEVLSAVLDGGAEGSQLSVFDELEKVLREGA